MPAELVVERVPVMPAPLTLAARLRAAGLAHVTLLHAASPGATGWGRASWLAAAPNAESTSLDPLEDDAGPRPRGPLAATPRWIGAIPYEAVRDQLERPGWRPEERRPPPPCLRPIWRRYPALVHVEPGRDEVRVIGGESGVARLVDALRSEAAAPVAVGAHADDAEPIARHRARIARARELILGGHLYQVNLARRIDLRFDGDPWQLYAALVARAPAAFAAVLPLEDGWSALSTSPELLLEATPDPGDLESATWPRWSQLVTEPIKGTRPRGEGSEEDEALRDELERDPKERAELAMIVDVARNDLGRVCELGSVRVAQPPAVRTLPTVHHRVARVVGTPRAALTRAEVLSSMVPSGSVTGAPKRRAMEVIAELESARRGLYTGGFGYVAHDGGLRLAMAIRTAVVKDGAGSYWTGGGIVVGSDPDREIAETRWKAAQLG